MDGEKYSSSVMMRIFNFLERWGLLNTTFQSIDQCSSFKSFPERSKEIKKHEDFKSNENPTVRTSYRPRSIEDVEIPEDVMGMDAAFVYVGAKDPKFKTSGSYNLKDLDISAKEFANGEYPLRFSHIDYVKNQDISYKSSDGNAEVIIESMRKRQKKQGVLPHSCLTLTGFNKPANKKHKEHLQWNPLTAQGADALPIPSRLSILTSRNDPEQMISEPWGLHETCAMLETINSYRSRVSDGSKVNIDWVSVSKIVSSRNPNIVRTPEQCMVYFSQLQLSDPIRKEAKDAMFKNSVEQGSFSILFHLFNFIFI